MRPSIKHFSHEHFLFSEDNVNFDEIKDSIICRMCNRLFVGNQSVYVCYDDGYAIHKTCAELPQHMNHQLHLHHRLTLVIRRSTNINNTSIPTSTCCYYCDLPFQKYDINLYYACDECPHFYMHPTCANNPLPEILTETAASSVDDDKDHDIVRFVCHKKPMEEEKHEDGDGDGDGIAAEKHRGEKCFACRSFWSDHLPAYSCTTKTCNNFLHKSCADKLPRRIQVHPFHPQHPLMLHVSKPPSCDLCCQKDQRLVFNCVEDGCNINLCTNCAFLKKNINCRSHDHSLSLVENFAIENSHGFRCDACRKDYKKCSEVNATQSYLFRCMECDFDLHFLCGPLPITLKYEYHIHSLSLVDHSDTKDDSNEYYCDVCEEERDPQCRLYYCASCKYNAHIHCLLHQIMKVIKGDTKNVELCALGENRWSLFDIESINHETKELSTLRDLMDSLTEPEKKLLTNPYDFEDNEKLLLKGRFLSCRENNSRFEGEGSFEDIDWIQQLFHFCSNDFDNLQEELCCFMYLEGLKVNEMYLRQKVIEVDGYLVPKTLAPILKTLLRKHGDLGEELSLTSGLKSVAATLLCAIIDEMCRANVEDITKDVLKQWYSDLIGVTHMAGFREIIDGYSFVELILRALPGLKAMRYKKDIGEKLDLEIAKLEAKLKQCKENKEKLETFESESSDFLKECLGIVKKLEGKKVGDVCVRI